MADKNFIVKNGLTVGGADIVNSSGVLTQSLITAVPSGATAATQSVGNSSTALATTAYVRGEIDALIDSAPGTLNTLDELAAAINDDAAFNTTLTNAVALKAPLASPTFTGTVNAAIITASGAITGSSVNATGGYLNGSNGGIRIHTSGTKFFNVTAANAARDNIMDVGALDARFKDGWFGGTVSAVNFKINNGQGSDGQVLTSTGSGVAWEDAVGGVDGISSAADATGIWISSSEHLGINISNNTWGRLNVHESSSTIASAVISQGSSGGNALEINDGSSDSGGNLLVVGGDGDIGIGTTSPSTRLHLKEAGSTSAVNEFIRAENSAGGGAAAGSSINFHHYHAGGGPAGGAKAASITAQNMDSWAAGTPSGYSTGLTFGTIHANTFEERMRINSDGTVGIGTASPSSYNSAARNLVVVGDGGNTGISIVAGTSHNSTLMFADGTGGTAGYRGRVDYDHNGDYMAFHTAAGEKVRITSDGDVGIGTGGAPTAGVRLQINDSANAAIMELTGTGSRGLRLFTRKSNYPTDSGQNDAAVVYNAQDTEASSIYGQHIFQTGGTTRMQVNKYGVGIGALAPTNAGISGAGSPVLSINGSVPEINLVDTDSGKNDYWIRVSDGLQIGEASDSRLYLKNGGNLFLGMTSGHHESSNRTVFEMSGTSSALIGFDINGSYSTYLFDSGTSGTFEINHPNEIYLNADSQLRFATGTNVEAMTIKSDGDVGIGTTAPSQKLHVFQTEGSVGAKHAAIQLGGYAAYKDRGPMIAAYRATGNSNDQGLIFSTYNASTAVNDRYKMGHSGKHEFFGVHQGDSVGHFIFTNQAHDSNSTGDSSGANCTLMVRNGNAQVQIMPWAALGARIGTRGGGWNSNSNNAVHLTSNDAVNIILNTNGSPTLANSTAISSDERLKKNITDIASGQLAKINALKPRNFEWKDSRKPGAQEGFIAQEVETSIPEAVEDRLSSPDPDDTSRDFEGDIKVIKHEVLNARLIKAVQELSAELDAAKARITTLESS